MPVSSSSERVQELLQRSKAQQQLALQGQDLRSTSPSATAVRALPAVARLGTQGNSSLAVATPASSGVAVGSALFGNASSVLTMPTAFLRNPGRPAMSSLAQSKSALSQRPLSAVDASTAAVDSNAVSPKAATAAALEAYYSLSQLQSPANLTLQSSQSADRVGNSSRNRCAWGG